MTCKINADTSDGLKLISDTSGAVEIQSNGVTKVSIDSSGNISTVAGMSTSNGNIAPLRPNAKPIIINGNMAIAQRSAAVTGLGDGDEGYVTVDRIRHTHDGTTAGRYTSTHEAVDDIPGFHESLNINVTTADTSIAAGEGFNLEYKFEGHDLHHLQKGHSTAKPFTISFYAKADAAVVYGVEFKDADNNRHCTRTFTTTTGWTRHVLAFPADTTGKYNNDNGHSASFRIWLHAGSNFTSGTAAAVFQGVTTANTAVGIGSIFASTDRFISITGLQMEIGDYDINSIPDFQYESFGDNLFRCQRYCTAITKEASYGPVMMAHGIDANVCRGAYFFRTPMRSAPSFTHTGNIIRSFDAATALSSATAVSSRFSHSIDWTGSNLFAANEGILITFDTGTASLIYSAEL